jgi:hypothetical protein
MSVTTAAELRERIALLVRNVREGEAGAWDRAGYDAETRARCLRDAGNAVERYRAELRAMGCRPPRPVIALLKYGSNAFTK